MTNELKQAQTALAEVIQNQNRMNERVREYFESVAEGRKIVNLFQSERETAERQLVKGLSTPAAVATIEKKLKESEEKLQSFERLLAFSKEELLTLDKAIVTARQALANARYQFCINEKQRIADELNQNTTFKNLLTAAYAANASNNLRYTADWRMFVSELIAEPPASEIESAKREFLVKNSLTD